MCYPGHCLGGINCANSQQVGEGCESPGAGCTACYFGHFGDPANPIAPIGSDVFSADGTPHPAATEGKFGMVLTGGLIPAGLQCGDLVIQIDGNVVLAPQIWLDTLHTVGPRTYKVWRAGAGVIELTI